MKIGTLAVRVLTVIVLTWILGTTTSAAPQDAAHWPDARFSVGPLLYQEDFTEAALKNWTPDLEAGGTVTANKGRLTIDVPRGATVWFKPELTGPVLIQYEATAIGNGGPNDRVSDLNCFWMAQDPSHPDQLLTMKRTGKFSDYDALTTYYVGQGGNGNTTTRFRRYIGQTGNRPIRLQDDLRGPEFLLKPNVTQTIRLVAFDGLIQYYCDNRLLFEMQDDAPYRRGWFGLRTTESHLEIQHLRIYRLIPLPQALKK